MPIQGGGMATTSNGIVFVTGTPDNFVRAFDTDDGALLWEYEMLAAGSSPPIVFQSSGSDYLAVVATGGKFSGYSAVASKIYIFKL
jgi:quinoprotein glucose dehydrogenase